MIQVLLVLFYLFYPFQKYHLFGIYFLKPYYLIIIFLVFIYIFFNKILINKYLLYFYLIFLALLCFFILSNLYSFHNSVSIFYTIKYFTYFIIGIMFSSFLIKNEKNIYMVNLGIFISSILISIGYLYTFFIFGGLNILYGKVDMNSISSIAAFNFAFSGGRNMMAIWLVFALTFSLPILFKSYKNHKMRLLFILFSLFILFAIILSLSRTALVLLFIFILYSSLFSMDIDLKKITRLSFLTLLLFFICIVSFNILHIGSFLYERYNLIFADLEGKLVDYGVTGRLTLWHYAIKSFYKNPFLGDGIGILYNGRKTIEGVNNYHNFYLQLIAQIGILGFLLFISWSFLLFYISYKIRYILQNKNTFFIAEIVFINLILYYIEIFAMSQYFDMQIWTVIAFIGYLLIVSYKEGKI